MPEQGVVVVTGASSGIGRATALRLGQSGRTVVCAARRQAELAAVAESIGASGGTGLAVAADVRSEGDVRRLFDAAERAGQVRGVVHAAGVLAAIGPVAQLDLVEWAEVIRANLVASAVVLKYAARAMLATGQPGSIVMLSGGGASYGFPHYSAYAASKAAVVRLAETAAMELSGTGIAVTALAPGFVPTGIHAATIDAGPGRAGEKYHALTQHQLRHGSGQPLARAVDAVIALLSDQGRGLSGRFISAVHDDLAALMESAPLLGEDSFRLRRNTQHSGDR